MAHPGHLRLIFRAHKKNDRVDAEKIAKLLYLNELPAVHVPDPEVRAWRELIIARDRAVAQRTRVKNALRSLLRSHQIRSPRSLWSREGLGWLAGLALPTAAARLRRDVLLDDLDHARRQVLRLNRELDAIGRGREGVALLTTIPGVGPRTAEAVCALARVMPAMLQSGQVWREGPEGKGGSMAAA